MPLTIDLLFMLFFLLFLQDEKNQIMKSNVWLRMVCIISKNVITA